MIIPDLQGKLQFDYEIHGKDKIITFKFQKDYLEQFRTRKADTVDLAIKKFRNRPFVACSNLLDSTKVQTRYLLSPILNSFYR